MYRNNKDDSHDSSEIRRNILRRSFSRNFTERHIHIDVRRKNMYNLFFLKNAVRHNYSIIIFILVHTYIRTIRTYVFSFLVNLSYSYICTGTYIRTNYTMVFVVPYVRYIVTILIPYFLELKVTGAIFQVYRIWQYNWLINCNKSVFKYFIIRLSYNEFIRSILNHNQVFNWLYSRWKIKIIYSTFRYFLVILNVIRWK